MNSITHKKKNLLWIAFSCDQSIYNTPLAQPAPSKVQTPPSLTIELLKIKISMKFLNKFSSKMLKEIKSVRVYS